MTLGGYRVNLEINTEDPRALKIKVLCAELIDYVNLHKADHRTGSVAMTNVEDACMWCVKAVTKEPYPIELSDE